MDQTCLNNHIISLQCKHGELGLRLEKSLRGGFKKTVCLDRHNVAVARLLNVLRCYKTFTADVTYAHSVSFQRVNDGSTTITFTLKDNVLTPYTGTGTAEEIAIYFQDQIDAGGLTSEYLTERVGAILYIYSYDATAAFTDVTTVTPSNTLVTVNVTNLQNDLDEILNLWNSLTADQICSILTMTTKFVEKGKIASPSSSSGCNC